MESTESIQQGAEEAKIGGRADVHKVLVGGRQVKHGKTRSPGREETERAGEKYTGGTEGPSHQHPGAKSGCTADEGRGGLSPVAQYTGQSREPTRDAPETKDKPKKIRAFLQKALQEKTKSMQQEHREEGAGA